MKERPAFWEIICKTCLAGGVVSDEWVSKRVHIDRLWPKHCGRIMSLRHFKSGERKPKENCNVASCRFATYGKCNCACLGKFHGINNEKKQFHTVTIAPLHWYNQPFSEILFFK